MYVIKYDRDIYAGTYNDMDGCYLVEEKANEMISRAELLAKEIRLGSIEYAEDVLTTVEHNLKSILQEVERNRIELNPGK